MTWMEIGTRLAVATVLGGLIGLERERHGRAAGLRTHLLVCVGSALIMLTSWHVAAEAAAAFGPSGADPARIAAQVVSGIGFLGAGTILRSRVSVVGLTTAASLWAVAGVGLAVGAGFYSGALIGTGLVFGALVLLTPFERAFLRKGAYRILVVEARGGLELAGEVRAVLERSRVTIQEFNVRRSGPESVTFEMGLKQPVEHEALVLALLRLPGVTEARWQ